jgi:dTMP kinase
MKKKKHGLFITFEGIDGSGKSSQLRLANRFLRKAGFDTLVLREPGSAPLSERIRKILLDPKLQVAAYPELLLYLAARGQLVSETIAPALERGAIVLCDRFHDSTVAYQGYGRRLDLDFIEQLRLRLVGKVSPHRTYVFDVDYPTSLSRRKKAPDRLERESELFFKRVRAGFRKIAREEPKRALLVDSMRTLTEISADVCDDLDKLLRRKKLL